MEIVKNLINDTELKKVFDIVVPISLLDKAIDETVLEKQKTYKLDGFRAGKVPVSEIKKKEKTNLFYSASDKVINDLVNDIIKANDYKLSSQVSIDFKTFDMDKDLEISAVFELIPTIPEIEFDKIKIDYYKSEITDKDIDSSIERILSSYKNWDKKEDKAENGDTTKINFVGSIDGVEFDGGKGEDYNLELGSNTFISGFEDQLIGTKAGDKVVVKTKFPDTYHVTNLAGKDVDFAVDVLEVLSAGPVELNDDFVKNNFGIDGLEVFKNSIKTELENTAVNMSKYKAKDALIKELNENINFNLPEKALQERIDVLKKYKKQDGDVNSKDEEIEKEATTTLKCGYIFSDLADKNDIVISDSDLTEAIMKEAQKMVGNEERVINFYKSNARALDNLRAQILENKIIDFLIDKVNKNEIIIPLEGFNNL